MTAPPGYAPTPKPTGGIVSVAVYDGAACAIKRAGIEPTRSRVRAVVRAWQAAGSVAFTDHDYWDRLIRELPLGLRRQRTTPRRAWAVTS